MPAVPRCSATPTPWPSSPTRGAASIPVRADRTTPRRQRRRPGAVMATVDTIVDRFAALNPYDRAAVPGSILKIEKENFDHPVGVGSCGAGHLRQAVRPLHPRPPRTPTPAHIDATKNAASRRRRSGARQSLRTRPRTPPQPTRPRRPQPGLDHRRLDLPAPASAGMPASPPAWLDRPALTRVTASSPTVLHWFAGLNAGKPYAEQIKPANFLLLAHPNPLDPTGALPIAPYDGRRPLGTTRLDRPAHR